MNTQNIPTTSAWPNLLLLFVLIAALSSCQKSTADQYLDALPPLPADIRAGLDPAKLSTPLPTMAFPAGRVVADVEPQRAPCCHIERKYELEVSLAYTKCIPWVVAAGDFPTSISGGREKSVAYKLEDFDDRPEFPVYQCFSSEGPWSASLTEIIPCNVSGRTYVLRVAVMGELVNFIWAGTHDQLPEEIGVISCRFENQLSFPCNGLSACACSSFVCEESDGECDCPFDW